MLQAKGLCLWLLKRDPAISTWSEAFNQHTAAMSEPVYFPAHLSTYALDEHLGMAWLARRFDEGVASYRLKLPNAVVDAKKAMSPRDFAYLLCAGHEDSQPTPPEVLNAGHRMLKHKLSSEWLGRGQSLRAAMWLKIVNDAEGSERSPREALLSAYDDMTKVVRPEFAR